MNGAAEILAGAVLVSLNAYVLLAGADFGGGVWDLLASGPRRAEQRSVIAEAIAPVWEANHVWLILALVLLFTCFPPAFAQLSIRLHVPLAMALVGVVLRGSAFAFRSYGGQRDEVQRHWGRLFASASVGTPFLLGTAVGAVAAGRVGESVASSPGFYAGYMAPWLSAFPASVGVFALTCFAFLAAVYLPLETDDPEIREDFRRRALAAGLAVAASGTVALALSRGIEPLQRGLLGAPWATPLHLLTGAAGAAALAGVWLRRWRVARIAAASEVSLILWGWALGQYPYLVPPTITIDTAAAPPETLTLAMVALGLGGLLLFPSLYYLFRLFKARSPHAD
ncbi:MAG TPA: cytochrome d ubiquinol oxidase subunit II [Gemmatimonadales bacterium]|nr:cytochrome d ubiquinol oxidase subunit II [Gemmatimonadales bacterium]